MLKAVIIDDDELSRKVLENYISRSHEITLIREFDSALTALSAIESIPCDLIFLDIEMPEMSGLEFISRAVNIPQIIVVSSKSDYAAEAFNYDVTDYIVKPIVNDRFLKSIEKAKLIQQEVIVNNPNKDHLFFKKNSAFVRVDFKDICYVEAYADYVSVFTTTERFVVLSTMKAIEQRFPKNEFMRVHRSYIVQLDKVKSIQDNALFIKDKTIPISRSYKAEFMTKMNIF